MKVIAASHRLINTRCSPRRRRADSYRSKDVGDKKAAREGSLDPYRRAIKSFRIGLRKKAPARKAVTLAQGVSGGGGGGRLGWEGYDLSLGGTLGRLNSFIRSRRAREVIDGPSLSRRRARHDVLFSVSLSLSRAKITFLRVINGLANAVPQ